jgi:hypothetical protein
MAKTEALMSLKLRIRGMIGVSRMSRQMKNFVRCSDRAFEFTCEDHPIRPRQNEAFKPFGQYHPFQTAVRIFQRAQGL